MRQRRCPAGRSVAHLGLSIARCAPELKQLADRLAEMPCLVAKNVAGGVDSRHPTMAGWSAQIPDIRRTAWLPLNTGRYSSSSSPGIAPIDTEVVTAAHVGSSLPACSRTMYSAYQSGQFSSRWPLRFSCSPCAAAARRSAIASSVEEVNVVPCVSTRPGNRAVISWSSQPLPSASLNDANER